MRKYVITEKLVCRTNKNEQTVILVLSQIQNDLLRQGETRGEGGLSGECVLRIISVS